MRKENQVPATAAFLSLCVRVGRGRAGGGEWRWKIRSILDILNLECL